MFSIAENRGYVLVRPPRDIVLDTKKYSFATLAFERAYDGLDLVRFSRLHYWLAPLTATAYIIIIFGLKRYMRNKKPVKALDHILPLWNISIALFSIIGTIRLMPYLGIFLYQNGLNNVLCSPPAYTYGRGPPGLWTGLFVYSKYFELVDTLFIVLRKSKLSFIHWFHHASVLLFTWDAFVREMPAGIIFSTMNYTVHSLMYTYYYLASSGSRPKWGITVTILQILQMIFGVAITIKSSLLAAAYNNFNSNDIEAVKNPIENGTCYYDKFNLSFASLVYVSYLYLFVTYFIERHYKPVKSHYKTL